MNQQTLLIAAAIALCGFAYMAASSPPEERRGHFVQLFVAVLVGAFLLLVAPPS